MAYTPTDWECGQTVTAEKLNNIERGVAEVNSEYTPTTWQYGDVITAEKMNKIEQGIANAGGGSSDFSTAEVTLMGNDEYMSVYMPTLNGGYIGADSMDYGIVQVGTYTVPLGQNGTYITVFATVSAISGDIEDIGEDHFLITGDCTITIS